MERVTVTYARTQLSKLAACAKAGETIEITRRGKVVAQLKPIEPATFPISHPLQPSRIFLAQAAVKARGRGRETAVG